jgi:DNA-binding NarL/FixJ family response regulator
VRRVRVLVVDDHHMLREALVGLLELAGFEVVGAVADGADATFMATELAPDVVLMDLSMPVLNGLDATRLLREVAPEVAIVMFSAFDSPELKRQAFAAGAVAYLTKGCSNERLRATLEAAVTLAAGNFRQPI